eukprot:4429348-Pyramimonas_sp.AAC.1
MLDVVHNITQSLESSRRQRQKRAGGDLIKPRARRRRERFESSRELGHSGPRRGLPELRPIEGL